MPWNVRPSSLFKGFHLRLSALFSLLACLLLLAVAKPVRAQDFGLVPVGGPAVMQPVTVPLADPGSSSATFSVFTLGAQNLDFTQSATPPLSCVAGSCTVSIRFLPTAVGTRLGAVVATDSLGNTSTAYISGTGTGPLVAFGPGTISTFAGTGTAGYNGDGIAAITAELYNPIGVAMDGAGNLYISDYNQRIRKVTPGGTISTVAGTGTAGYGGDNGPATSAQLSYPFGIAVDGAGNLYIADRLNNRVRKVTPGGTISTVAGTGTAGYGGDKGLATSAELDYPTGVAVDGTGNLYIADSANQRIRMVTPGGGIITTVAGTGVPGYSGDTGPATSANLDSPFGVAVDGAGNLYIADYDNNRIRKVTGGIITTVAGTGVAGYGGDKGPATSAELYNPYGVAVDGVGNFYIADNYNNRIRQVVDGVITTVAGAAAQGYGGDNGPATSAELYTPFSVAVDSSGNLYIADTENQRIRKVEVSKPPSLSFGTTNIGQASAPQDVSVMNLGNASLTINRISTAVDFSLGGLDTTCTSGQLLGPFALRTGHRVQPHNEREHCRQRCADRRHDECRWLHADHQLTGHRGSSASHNHNAHRDPEFSRNRRDHHTDRIDKPCNSYRNCDLQNRQHDFGRGYALQRTGSA